MFPLNFKNNKIKIKILINKIKIKPFKNNRILKKLIIS